MTSVEGKVLGTVKIQERGQGQVTIKVATYPSGTYYYSLIVDGEVFETKRMVMISNLNIKNSNNDSNSTI